QRRGGCRQVKVDAEIERRRIDSRWSCNEIKGSSLGRGKGRGFVVEETAAGPLPVRSCLDVTRGAPSSAQIDVVLAVSPVVGDGDEGNAGGGNLRGRGIGHAGTGRGEELPEGAAVGSSALGEAELLGAVDDEVDLFARRVVEADVAAFGGELEVEMIRALLRIVVGFEMEITFCGHEAERGDDGLVGPTDG